MVSGAGEMEPWYETLNPKPDGKISYMGCLVGTFPISLLRTSQYLGSGLL